MTISIWRYSHLTLALVSGLFLVLASVTGIILALEPIQSAIRPYQAENLSEISLAETLKVLREEYDEVLTLEVDANDFLLADLVTKTGESKSVYIHPKTGQILGEPRPQHPVFQFATNLHRSLFLKGIGRFFVGLVSFLLCLIAITGLLLIIKRQGGIQKLFSRVQKDYFELRYHVILGRWFLVPILLVAASGVYLSAEKFDLLPTSKVSHELLEVESEVDMSVRPEALLLFKDIYWDEVRKLTFPFSEFPEDYFELALKNRELYVHQYTGAVLSEQPYPFTFLINQWSLTLHTGQGSVLWSLVLLLTSGSVLFFIYSGFVMWRRRIKNSKVIKSKWDKDECTHIILVGSETGSTYAFAEALDNALTKTGKKVFVSEINAYSTYEKAEQLVFLTATYGEGEAPTNAKNINTLLQSVRQKNSVQYAVVGFGSLVYPSYCQFAIELDGLLGSQEGFSSTLPLYKINNQSFEAFADWSKQWGLVTETDVQVKRPKQKRTRAKQRPFEVIHKTELNVDDTYVLQLKPKKKIAFQSGDLWEIVPKEDEVPRWYSIARYRDTVLLSIKKHDYGLCSNLLHGLRAQENILGGIKRNAHFHFPKEATELICIANGTGVAPFLGIFDENEGHIPIHLYWGGRTKESLKIYDIYLDEAISTNKLSQVHLALSQNNGTRTYVQDLLERDKVVLAQKMAKGAVFMICGSVAMQCSVLEILERIALEELRRPLADFEYQGQLKMDCY